MKRLTLIAAVILLLTVFCACGAQPASTVPSSSPSESAGDAEAMVHSEIGFCLKDSAFSTQLAAEIEAVCADFGYTPTILTADSVGNQKKDIREALAKSVQVIVIDPVNVDSLEAELSECESSGVALINIMDSINGKVSTLIAPDYNTIGRKAGERAVALLDESGGNCLELKTGYDSFTMQLMSDGFDAAIADSEDVKLFAYAYCGMDEEKAYATVKQHLNDIDFIFAQSAELGRGAMRAVSEGDVDVKIVVYGGDADIIEAVAAGTVNAALFVDPAQLAAKAIADADGFIKDPSYTPAPYQELDVYRAKQDNAAQCLTGGSAYAKAPEDG